MCCEGFVCRYSKGQFPSEQRLANMPRPRLTVEERRSRELQRKQAQRERARQQTLARAAETTHVRVIDPGNTRRNVHTTAAHAQGLPHDDGPSDSESFPMVEAAGADERPFALGRSATLEPEETVTAGHRYGLRPRANASPSPAASAIEGTGTDIAQSVEVATSVTQQPPRGLTVTLRPRMSRSRSNCDQQSSSQALAPSSQDLVLDAAGEAIVSPESYYNSGRNEVSVSTEVVVADEDWQSLAQGVVDEGDDNSTSAQSVISSDGTAPVLAPRSGGASAADPSTDRALPWAAARPSTPPALDAAIELIASRETSAGLRFIEAQASAYRTVFQRAFTLHCPCACLTKAPSTDHC